MDSFKLFLTNAVSFFGTIFVFQLRWLYINMPMNMSVTNFTANRSSIRSSDRVILAMLQFVANISDKMQHYVTLMCWLL